MKLRLLFSLLIFISLSADEKSWYSSFNVKIEAGYFVPVVDGTIFNNYTTTYLSDELNYAQAKSSYFSLEINPNNNYPTVRIDYLNMKDNRDANLSSDARLAETTFSSYISSDTEYSVLNTYVYHEFKKKSSMISMFGKGAYLGDIEFDVGVNVKLIQWYFQVQDLTNLTQSPSWITVDSLIALPYLGFKYYLYDFIAYSSISALSFSKAKSINYQLGADYRVIDNLYLSATYLYEQFKAVERQDTIDFDAKGYKFGFKYLF